MIGEIDNLFIVAEEECVEIAHALSKSLRFGSNNHAPDDCFNTNGDQVMTEFYQLQEVILMLQEKGVLPTYAEKKQQEIRDRKRQKVRKWQKYSQKIGRVSVDPTGIPDLYQERGKQNNEASKNVKFGASTDGFEKKSKAELEIEAIKRGELPEIKRG